MRKFDTDGDGSISIQEFMQWAGVPYIPAAALEVCIYPLPSLPCTLYFMLHHCITVRAYNCIVYNNAVVRFLFQW
jgi:EF hand